MSDFDAATFAEIGRKSKDAATPVRTGLSSLAANSTYRTELSVSGAGYLHSLAFYSTSPTAHYFRVTVDGGTPFIVGDNTGAFLYFLGKSGSTNYGMLVLGSVRFKSSLLVEIGGASGSVRSAITYSLG